MWRKGSILEISAFCPWIALLKSEREREREEEEKGREGKDEKKRGGRKRKKEMEEDRQRECENYCSLIYCTINQRFFYKNDIKLNALSIYASPNTEKSGPLFYVSIFFTSQLVSHLHVENTAAKKVLFIYKCVNEWQLHLTEFLLTFAEICIKRCHILCHHKKMPWFCRVISERGLRAVKLT